MCPEHYKVWEQRHVWYACKVLKHYICNTARWAWGFSPLQTVKTVSSILKISHFLSRYLLHLKAGRWRPHTCTQTHWIWGPHLFLRTTTSGWTPRGWCKLMVSPLRRNTHTLSPLICPQSQSSFCTNADCKGLDFWDSFQPVNAEERCSRKCQ